MEIHGIQEVPMSKIHVRDDKNQIYYSTPPFFKEIWEILMTKLMPALFCIFCSKVPQSFAVPVRKS